MKIIISTFGTPSSSIIRCSQNVSHGLRGPVRDVRCYTGAVRRSPIYIQRTAYRQLCRVAEDRKIPTRRLRYASIMIRYPLTDDHLNRPFFGAFPTTLVTDACTPQQEAEGGGVGGVVHIHLLGLHLAVVHQKHLLQHSPRVERVVKTESRKL